MAARVQLVYLTKEIFGCFNTLHLPLYYVYVICTQLKCVAFLTNKLLSVSYSAHITQLQDTFTLQ